MSIEEWAASRLGHVSPAGELRHVALPTPGSEPHGRTLGPDGAVWVAVEIGTVARVVSPPV